MLPQRAAHRPEVEVTEPERDGRAALARYGVGGGGGWREVAGPGNQALAALQFPDALAATDPEDIPVVVQDRDGQMPWLSDVQAHAARQGGEAFGEGREEGSLRFVHKTGGPAKDASPRLMYSD